MDRKAWNEPFDEVVLLDGAGLPRGSLLSIRDGRGAVLFVESGEVWVTQEGDQRDVVLSAGAWFRLDHDGATIVQARRAAAVTLTAAADVSVPEIRAVPRGRARNADGRRRGSLLRALTALWLRSYRRAEPSISRRYAASV